MNWDKAKKVSLEEAAECYMFLAKYYYDSGATSKEEVVKRWLKLGNRVRAFIVPHDSGYYSISVHYGKTPNESIVFVADAFAAKQLIL